MFVPYASIKYGNNDGGVAPDQIPRGDCIDCGNRLASRRTQIPLPNLGPAGFADNQRPLHEQRIVGYLGQNPWVIDDCILNVAMLG